MNTVCLTGLSIVLALAAGACGQGGKSGTDLAADLSRARQEKASIEKRITELESALRAQKGEAAAADLLPVTLASIRPEHFATRVEVFGTLDSSAQAEMSCETAGRVEAIPAGEGDRVRKGQVILRLNADPVERSMEEIRASLTLARTVRDRRERLWAKKIGSEVALLESRNQVEGLEKRLASLEAQRDMAVIRAPFDGTVDRIFLKLGELAMPGSTVARVVDSRNLLGRVDVSEKYIGVLTRGAQVAISFPHVPALRLDVPVTHVGKSINANNRTFEVLVHLDQKDERLKPNLMMSMSFEDFSTDGALLVPVRVLKTDRDGYYLYIAQSTDGRLIARKRSVVPGPGDGRNIMIREGLEPGDQVVVDGASQVSDGMPLKVKP